MMDLHTNPKVLLDYIFESIEHVPDMKRECKRHMDVHPVITMRLNDIYRVSARCMHCHSKGQSFYFNEQQIKALGLNTQRRSIDITFLNGFNADKDGLAYFIKQHGGDYGRD